MKGRGALAAALAVAVPGGALVVGAFWLWRRRKVQMLTNTLRDGLPIHVEKWANEIAAAAIASVPPGVDVERWAFVFAGIVSRESGGGLYLDPPAADGLGDNGHGHGLAQVDDRPAPDDASDYEKQLAAKRRAHIGSGDWKDPRKHLRFAAVEVLRGAYDQFADVEDTELRIAAAVAAYNSGVDNVRRQLDAGRDVNAVTTKKDYARDVLARADNWSGAAAAVGA